VLESGSAIIERQVHVVDDCFFRSIGTSGMMKRFVAIDTEQGGTFAPSTPSHIAQRELVDLKVHSELRQHFSCSLHRSGRHHPYLLPSTTYSSQTQHCPRNPNFAVNVFCNRPFHILFLIDPTRRAFKRGSIHTLPN
jgi:hypothetical protein